MSIIETRDRQTGAHGSPLHTVESRNVIDGRSAGLVEITTGDQLAVVCRQSEHCLVGAGAKRSPRSTVPSSDVAGRNSAHRCELTTDHEQRYSTRRRPFGRGPDVAEITVGLRVHSRNPFFAFLALRLSRTSEHKAAKCIFQTV